MRLGKDITPVKTEKLIAMTSTDDCRLTKGKIYEGIFVQTKSALHCGLRFFAKDNSGRWMTFNPNVFR